MRRANTPDGGRVARVGNRARRPHSEPSPYGCSVEVRVIPRDPAPPPRDPPTVPLTVQPRAPDQSPVPLPELGGPGAASSEPLARRSPQRGSGLAGPVPVPSRRRRARRSRAVLLPLVLGVLVATATADVGPSAAPAPPPVSDPARAPAGSPAPDVDPFVAARDGTSKVDQIVQGASVGHVSVAALDVATGRSFDYAPDTPIRTASVVKLDVLAALLLQSQDDGRPPSAEARELATRMIEQSDNEAASRLWEDLGGVPALDAANRRLGLRATHLLDRWGSSTTSASDQLALLAALHTSGPLHPASRSYARDLMTRVVDEQRWGVSAAADPGTTAALKNGWAPADSGDGRWAVGSVGIITVNGSPVLLAVLTERQPSRDAGIQLVEALSRIAAHTVTRMSPAPAAPR